jgi:hypothetical protein
MKLRAAVGRRFGLKLLQPPAQFVRSMTDGPSKFTAEAWCFCLYTWHQFFSTVRNTMTTSELIDIIKTCIFFTITHPEIANLRVQIVNWVKIYER